MTFRYARHTVDIERLIGFYTDIAGLKKLGGFKDHAGYDGVFLGNENNNWHLEFTQSADKPTSISDEDDALVFYLNTRIEVAKLKEKIEKTQLPILKAKNPYWQEHGLMTADPDGHRVIFSYKEMKLSSKDDMTQQIIAEGISNWDELTKFVQALPYGRNANRADLSLVLKEKQGTCSSKHAFLKKVAELNHIPDVKLIIGLYRMNNKNTPKIGTELIDNNLEYVPEAHCYLKLNNQRIDFTSLSSDINNLIGDVIEEQEISPEQVNEYKVQYHQAFVREWITREQIPFTFEEVWKVREQCIANLSM
jgi:hypothetical protein